MKIAALISVLILSLFNSYSYLSGAVEVEKLNVELARLLNIKNTIEKEEFSLNEEEFEEKYSSIERKLLNLYNQSSETALGARILMELGMLYQYKLVDYERAIKVFSEIIQKYPKSYYVSKAKHRIEQCKRDLTFIQKNLLLLKENPKQEIAASLLLQIARVYSNNRLRKFKARQAYWEIYKRYPLSKEAAYALHELLRGGYYKDIEEKLDIGIIIIEDYPEFEEYENSKVRLIRCFLEEPIPTEKLKHVYETNKNSFIKAMSLFGLAKKNCETKRSTHKKRQEIIYNEEGIDLLKKIDQEFSKTEVGDDALGNLAIHYYSKSDVENFRRILSLIEKKYPNATDVLHSYEEFQYEWIPALLLGYGELIFKVKKDGQKAKKVYQKVIKRYPNSRVITDFFCMFGVAGAEAQKEIAEIYTKQRNFERAVSEYKKLVLEFPEAIMGKLYTCGMISYGEVGLSEIVKIYKDNLKDQESLNNLMKDIITQSKSGGILAYCYNYLAKSALADGDPKAAITYYKRSAAFDLSALEEILQICLAKLNNPLLALKELEEIKNNFQNNTAKGCTTYLIAKVYYDELKDFMKGANLFKEFIINYPSGVGNEMYGPYYGAEEPFKKIVMAYRKKEDYEGLRRELGEIFEKCNSPHIKTKVLFTIAETFEKESNTAEAIETYKKLISQYPCSKEAREAKKKLKIEE